ncbi:hypothetical protein A2V82_09980 [candidate division KSB1 bacterium RBG_16_48_16]|nr:MAG: hypothetical protein A2V82_09980 [candidate division KSB1 bacterium RBG_16_48_16]
MLFAVITIVAGYYLSMSRTLPLLQEQIKINDPIIYADSIRPYHLEQLRSLPVSFFVAAAIALVLFFAFKYSDLLAEKIDLFLDKITFRSPLLKTINKTGFSAAGFLLMHAFLPLLFAGLISLKSHYLLLRNMVIVIPAYLLIISFAVIRLRQKWTRIGIISILVLFFMQSMICFEQWNKKDDWRSLAQIAKAKINDGEIILLDHLFGKKPFYYYGLRTAVPIRRVDAQKFLSNIQSDLWLLVSYKGEWTVRDSLAVDFEPIEDFNFSGSTNEDDLPTIDGHVHLIHYRRKQAGGENRLIRKMSTSLSINR